MPTFLFDNIIFGPVKSRRLGVSLGINLIPANAKICSFDCLYCECGWTNNEKIKHTSWPSFETFSKALSEKLISIKDNNQPLDKITFAGNGEPTMHPLFSDIIDETIRIRNLYFPKVKIAVLTNGTEIRNNKIFNSLFKVDENIIKLDSGKPSTIKILNRPYGKIDLDEFITQLKKFNGHCIIQALFVKGQFRSKYIDNTTDEEIELWLSAIKKIKPKSVQVYTFARDTALPNLEKIGFQKLKEIANKVRALGIEAQIFS